MIFLNEYLKHIFNIDDKTSATILIPVIITAAIFISGILTNLLIAWIREFIKRNRTKKAFQIILEDIILTCKEQQEALKVFSDSLDIDSKDNFDLKTKSFGHLRTMDKLNFNDLYNSWFRFWYYLNPNERIKSFNNCFKISESIRFYEKQISDYLNTFISSFNTNLNVFNKSIHNLRDTYDTLFIDDEIIFNDPALAEFRLSLKRIVSTYQQNAESEKITVKKNLLLLPILKLNRQSEQRVSLILNNHVLDAIHAFNNLDHSINTFKSLFSGISDSFKDFSVQLDGIIDI